MKPSSGEGAMGWAADAGVPAARTTRRANARQSVRLVMNRYRLPECGRNARVGTLPVAIRVGKQDEGSGSCILTIGSMMARSGVIHLAMLAKKNQSDQTALIKLIFGKSTEPVPSSVPQNRQFCSSPSMAAFNFSSASCATLLSVSLFAIPIRCEVNSRWISQASGLPGQ
jgi:hypothetical protein